jgi:hypothetical protein
MKTTDFSRILVDTAQLCGLDREEITDSTFIQLRDFANTRIRLAWEYDRWPDFIRYTHIPTVSEADEVYYVNKPAGAGEVIGIYDRNPNANTRAINVGFSIVHTNSEERFVLSRSYPDGVWMEYRIEPITINGEKWNAATAYSVGSQVYFDSGSNSGSYHTVAGKPQRGNFYTCISANTNTNPAQSTSNWSIVNIPYIFSNYIPRGVFADYLRSEGQFDSARIAEGEAQSFLDLEIDKVVRQQGQTQRYNFIKSY